jgi:hypothetical protein
MKEGRDGREGVSQGRGDCDGRRRQGNKDIEGERDVTRRGQERVTCRAGTAQREQGKVQGA